MFFFLFYGIIDNDLPHSDKQDCFTEKYNNTNNKQNTVINTCKYMYLQCNLHVRR